MAYSYITYTGNGSQANWTFPFPYLDPQNIYATINGNAAYITLVGPNTGQIIPTPAQGASIMILRLSVTPVSPVTFTDGSVLMEKDLDRLALFCLYSAQESLDRAAGGSAVVSGGGGLTIPQILTGLSAQITLDSFAFSLRDEIGLITAGSAVTGSVAYQVLQEATSRATGDTVISTQVSALSTTVAGNTASINTEATTRASSDLAIVATSTLLKAQADASAAAITLESAVRASADIALSTSLSALTAAVSTNLTTATGLVTTEATSRAAADAI